MIILNLAWTVVFFFFIAMIFRLIIDWIQILSRDWRPSGVVLVIAETVYSVTDPPIRALRRVLPSLRLGSVSIDLSFLVVFFLCSILLSQLPSW